MRLREREFRGYGEKDRVEGLHGPKGTIIFGIPSSGKPFVIEKEGA